MKKLCQYCNKEFNIYLFQKGKKFCSRRCYWDYMKGRPTWSSNLSKNDPRIIKFILAGKQASTRRKPWNKGLGGTGFPVGPTHPNWKGGVTPVNERIRKSVKYKIWRDTVFKRDNYICQLCGKRGGELNADHIKQFALYPEFRFEVSNGRTLCVNCHRKTFIFMGNQYV